MRSSTAQTSIRPSEITFALSIAVAVIWLCIIFIIFPGQPVLGGDFMEFYTFGALAHARRWALQYDWTALHQLQVALVPSSADYFYSPVYPPFIPALYLPFAWMPFTAAFAAWAGMTAAVYGTLMSAVAGCCRALAKEHVILGSLIFPGFIALICAGQTTVWPLVGFVTGWMALERGHPMIAGLLLSVVAVKPHFGLGLALVLFFTASWRIIAGGLVGACLHGATSLLVCGPAAVRSYVTATIAIAGNPAMVEPLDTRHTQSLHAAFSALMPPTAAFGAWLLLSACITWLAVRVWRANTRWTIRVVALLLASVLISPHLLVYDSVLLVPVVVWLLDDAIVARKWATAGGVLLLAGVCVLSAARVGGVHLALPIMIWLLSSNRNALDADARGFDLADALRHSPEQPEHHENRELEK
jgi:alpha-1,2-mannosyltransferase